MSRSRNRPSGKKRKAIAARRKLKRMDRQEAHWASVIAHQFPLGFPPSFGWDELPSDPIGGKP